jgi:hypothetical protein
MSTQITQKNAVLNEVKAVLGANFDSSLPAKDQLTADQLNIIRNNIFDGIVNGTISFNGVNYTDEQIKRYVSGMISNHFRKAKELNGGEQYAPQINRSRDEQVIELTKFLSTLQEGTDDYNVVLSALNNRKAELAKAKAELNTVNKKKKAINTINEEVLPESLKGLASSLLDV